MTLKERIEKYKNVILMVEIAGLLHDTGKLDSRFIDYRRKWQDWIDGWHYNNDPHDHEFFDNDECLKKNDFKKLREIFDKNIADIYGVSKIKKCFMECGIPLNISLKELMHQHTDPKHELSHLLKIGDSIDSAYDRNNPLYVNEQKDKKTYGSTVFGYESPLNVDCFNKTREALYYKLQDLLERYLNNFEYKDKKDKYEVRIEIFKNIEDACRYPRLYRRGS